MANSENESVWKVLGEARLGATGDMPFAYRVGLPDEPEIIDVSKKKIIKPRAIRIKNVTLTELLDRIEAALKRDRGNVAVLRKVLISLKALADKMYGYCAHSDSDARHIALWAGLIKDEVTTALAEPPRECDVGYVEDQIQRYSEFCRNHKKLKAPPIHSLEWAQRPYEEGGAA